MHRLLFPLNLILLFTLVISSCSVPRYYHSYSTPKSLGKTRSSILVYSPFNGNETHYKILKEGLNDLDSLKITYMEDARLDGNIIPLNLEFDVSDNDFDILSKGSSFDYVMCVRVVINEDDAPSVLISQPAGMDRNKVSITIRVYELKTRNVFYEQTVVGLSENRASTSPKKYPRLGSISAETLSINALRRGLKDCIKHSN